MSELVDDGVAPTDDSQASVTESDRCPRSTWVIAKGDEPGDLEWSMSEDLGWSMSEE